MVEIFADSLEPHVQQIDTEHYLLTLTEGFLDTFMLSAVNSSEKHGLRAQWCGS